MNKLGNLILGLILGSSIGVFVGKKTKVDLNSNSGYSNKKFKEYYNILNQWLWMKNSGKSMEQILLKYNIRSIAIYGMGEIGARLIEELNDSNIIIKYGIDNNVQKQNTIIEVLSDSEIWPAVDAIVVTAVFDYNNIRNLINTKGNYSVISIKDVVFENL